jgi:phosphohistidine phosphatase SixA
MRIVILVTVLALGIAGSAGAVQKSNRGRCRQIGKQLEQHAISVDRAVSQGNKLWAESTLQYMERLDARRERLCPDLYPQGNAAKAMAEMRRLLVTAGKLALKFFTLGAM